MMNYKKGKNVEEELTEDNIPIEGLPKGFLWMHVKGGTKVSNVVTFVKNAIDKGDYRSVVWSGSGGGVTKTISSAEILKRSYQLHQITRFCYRKVEEYWDPLLSGLEPIVASRQIPCIHILMSLDELNTKSMGYQAPDGKTKFWDEAANKKPQNKSNQRSEGKGKQNNHNRKNKSKAQSSQSTSQNK